MLCLGGEAVLPVPGLTDQSVTVGIRPEGFLPQADGPLSCTLNSVEVMGRDISVVASHPRLPVPHPAGHHHRRRPGGPKCFHRPLCLKAGESLPLPA